MFKIIIIQTEVQKMTTLDALKQLYKSITGKECTETTTADVICKLAEYFKSQKDTKSESQR